jgi:arylformamidase
MKYQKIIDISVELNQDTPIYPGNPNLEIETIKSSKTGSVLSKIIMGTHTGTHIDAPSHVFEGSKGMETYPIETFIGECRVLDCTNEKLSISIDILITKNIKKGERILLKTSNSKKISGPFFEDFVFLSPDAAKYLADIGVLLVAIDYFSIKQKGSPDNRPHEELLKKNIAIIEGVDLSQAEEGNYSLMALPLKLSKLDGAPARVVLTQG